MKELRQKMIRVMELKHLAKNTQKGYLHSVKGLAVYCNLSPDKITATQIEDYFLYLKKERNYALIHAYFMVRSSTTNRKLSFYSSLSFLGFVFLLKCPGEGKVLFLVEKLIESVGQTSLHI